MIKLFYNMKKNNFYSSKIAISILLFSGIISGCSDKDVESPLQETKHSAILTKSAYDNSFDWENSTKVNMVDGKGQIVKDVNLPWVLGVSNAGIPSDWIDANVEEDYSKRMYTKKNYWELVYSNITETTSYKYIVLYNKVTGILRCFYLVLSEPSGSGTTNSVWGICVNKTTSLFNFSTIKAENASVKKNSPAYITTPVGTFSSDKFSAVGFQNEVWYGMEMECAYDPSITISDDFTLNLMGRAIDKFTFTGTSNGTGTMEGTLTSAATNSSLNLSFSNMFNNNSSVTVNENSAAAAVGDKIEAKVEQKDPFFTSLWNNIKNNASKWVTSGLESGVKKGIEAIVSQGGSVVADALGGLFNSITGKRNDNISKINLKMVLNTKYSFEGEKYLPGWTDTRLPLPGTLLDSHSAKPLYNQNLGVWNLSCAPTLDLNVLQIITTKRGAQVISDQSATKGTYSCHLDQSIIILNPWIKENFTIANFKAKVVRSANECDPCIGHEILLGGEPYYAADQLTQTIEGVNDSHYKTMHCKYGFGLVQISFQLISKTNGEVFMYKKIFLATPVFKSEKFQYVEIGGSGVIY